MENIYENYLEEDMRMDEMCPMMNNMMGGYQMMEMYPMMNMMGMCPMMNMMNPTMQSCSMMQVPPCHMMNMEPCTMMNPMMDMVNMKPMMNVNKGVDPINLKIKAVKIQDIED